jgi:hypothetical protein
MTSPETLHMKNVANELRFPLVTHMARFDIRFGRYGILNSCIVLDTSVGFLGHMMVRHARV